MFNFDLTSGSKRNFPKYTVVRGRGLTQICMQIFCLLYLFLHCLEIARM